MIDVVLCVSASVMSLRIDNCKGSYE
jgi:hypothetical protein